MTSPVEVLHLKIEVMREGVIYLKEFSYSSNSLVYSKTSRMTPETEEDGWESRGWVQLTGPDGSPVMVNRESLTLLAEAANRKGWMVEWNPEYNPYMNDFRKRVNF